MQVDALAVHEYSLYQKIAIVWSHKCVAVSGNQLFRILHIEFRVFHQIVCHCRETIAWRLKVLGQEIRCEYVACKAY